MSRASGKETIGSGDQFMGGTNFMSGQALPF
jgi:hypothetical protein